MLLALRSGTLPKGAQSTARSAGDGTQVSSVQSNRSNFQSLDLALLRSVVERFMLGIVRALADQLPAAPLGTTKPSWSPVPDSWQMLHCVMSPPPEASGGGAQTQSPQSIRGTSSPGRQGAPHPLSLSSATAHFLLLLHSPSMLQPLLLSLQASMSSRCRAGPAGQTGVGRAKQLQGVWKAFGQLMSAGSN